MSAVISLLIAAIVALAFLLVNKSSVDSSGSTEASRKGVNYATPSNLTVDQAMSNLKNSGYTIKNVSVPFFSMIDANDGKEFDANKTHIELYTFDSIKRLTTAKEQLTSQNNDANISDTMVTFKNLLAIIYSTDKATIADISSGLRE